jgi:hypothetical protein
MAQLNGYLHSIGIVKSDQCACGQATETVEHFLFNCSLWETHRDCSSEQAETRRINLSYYLGEKAPSDPQTWKPNIEAVRVTLKYAIGTGRHDREVERTPASQTPGSDFY